jgi:hypothetical protein
MRLDEIVSLNDVLKASQFIRLMNGLKIKVGDDINTTRIKNQVLQSWKSGKRSRQHFDSLLGKINISLNDLIEK